MRFKTAILALTVLLTTLPTGCKNKSNPVYFIFINSAEIQLESQELSPVKFPIPKIPAKANPYPDWIQETFRSGSHMFPGIIITQLKKSVTFSRYTFYNKETGEELEIGLPADLGPFASISWNLIAQSNPWLVPSEPGIYELRVYLDEKIVASALFEVVAGGVSVSIGHGIFYSDKYNLQVNLPSEWAATEGPANIFGVGTIEGLVSFNSWGQSDFWVREINNSMGTGTTYSGSVVTSQIPEAGAYVALALENGPPYEGTVPEYELNNLSGLYEPHDWRRDSALWAYVKMFYKDGLTFRLEVFCHPEASDETVNALNDLLKSWRFLQ